MNINHEPVATRLMIDIKHQTDRVLGAPAARQSGVCIPRPRWAGGSSPRLSGRGPAAHQSGSLASGLRIPFFNLYTLKSKENIPRVNEYQL